ncbi:DNA repair protein RadC [Candidatus Desulfofervidus auxilii]|uniref:DNA repair protein RadC n=1 Tax=Desulfofervidus auxilii TaxID=1621989 RepID=A0A7U4THZ6_DESA2|nr:JAB domain-containing protein [Candidatus Desulfofervidus auxilii]AMM40756.1 DNA repair protein RadC [Candidatus Desulfofervidus auxilii]
MSSQQKTIYKCKFKTITLKIREKTPKYKVNSPEATFEFARKIYEQLDDDQEHCTVLFLNSKNQITGFKTIFSGGQNSAQVDPKIIFRNALLFGAVSIILIHNHPSGDVEPSEDDLEMTHKLKLAGEFLNIKVLDHIIISQSDFYSIASHLWK